MTDLGTLGLTGRASKSRRPTWPDSAGSSARPPTPRRCRPAIRSSRSVPRRACSTRGSVGYRRARWRAELTAFVNTIDGNIQKQALILPQGAVGTTLGGVPITSQNANGAVFVQATTVPVLVRANFDRARIWGLEHSGYFTVAEPLTLHTVFTYLRAKDLGTDLPPNIEGGTPAPEAYLLARWQRPQSNWWVEPYLHVAWKQTHLSSLDLGDRRTGSGRTRASIQAFFRNGARNRGWVGAGPDGTFGNADDVLIGDGRDAGADPGSRAGRGRQLVVALHGGPGLHDRRHPLRRQGRPSPGDRARREPERQELPRDQLGRRRAGPGHFGALLSGVLS